jgi:hypothetical protein
MPAADKYCFLDSSMAIAISSSVSRLSFVTGKHTRYGNTPATIGPLASFQELMWR